MAVYGLRHQRNRLAGEVKRMRYHNERYQQQIDELQSRIAENTERINKLNASIDSLAEAARLAYSTPVGLPVPRQTVPKHKFTEWGGITGEILRQLRLAERAPRTTEQLALAINEELRLNLAPQDLKKLRTSVRDNLKRLKNQGTVKRVSTAGGVGKFASWALAASAE